MPNEDFARSSIKNPIYRQCIFMNTAEFDTGINNLILIKNYLYVFEFKTFIMLKFKHSKRINFLYNKYVFVQIIIQLIRDEIFNLLF